MIENRLNNVLVIGRNNCSFDVINFIQTINKNAKVTLIDTVIDHYPLSFVKLIQGDPSDENILLYADIATAEFIVVTSGFEKVEREVDNKTLINLLSIRNLNKKAHCLAQIILKENIQKAKSAGADEVIFTNDVLVEMLSSSLRKKQKK